MGKNKIEAFKMVPVDSQGAHKVSVVPSFYPYGVVSMRGALCTSFTPVRRGGKDGGWGRASIKTSAAVTEAENPRLPPPLSLENNLNNYRPCFFIGDAKQLLAYVSPLFLSGRETMQGPLNFLKRSFFEDLFPSILLYRCRRGLERQCDSPPLFYRLTRYFLCVPQYSLSFVSFRVVVQKYRKFFSANIFEGTIKLNGGGDV